MAMVVIRVRMVAFLSIGLIGLKACSRVVAVEVVAGPVVDAEDRRQIGVRVGRRVLRAALVMKDVVSHVDLGAEEARAARIEDEHRPRPRLPGEHADEATRSRAVQLVGYGKRTDAVPTSSLELGAGYRGGRNRRCQGGQRGGQQAGDDRGATHRVLPPGRAATHPGVRARCVLTTTLGGHPPAVMTTIDPFPTRLKAG